MTQIRIDSAAKEVSLICQILQQIGARRDARLYREYPVLREGIMEEHLQSIAVQKGEDFALTFLSAARKTFPR